MDERPQLPLIDLLNQLVSQNQAALVFRPDQVLGLWISDFSQREQWQQRLSDGLQNTCLELVQQGDQWLIRDASDTKSRVEGRIRDEQGVPCARCLVEIRPEKRAFPDQVRERIGSIKLLTDEKGRFANVDLPAGRYLLQTYGEIVQNQPFNLGKNEALHLEILVAHKRPAIQERVVVPASHTLLNTGLNSQLAVIPRSEIEPTSHFNDDAFRLVGQLPGIATNDLSADFSIRGGAPKDVLIDFDGAELVDPYHLKAMGGFLSIIDSDELGYVQLHTSNFPVLFGNKVGGVFQLETQDPSERSVSSFSLDFLSSRIKTLGLAFDDRLSYLVTVRRSILDFAYDLATDSGDELHSQFDDLYLKLGYRMGNHHLSAHVLWSEERFKVSEQYPDIALPAGGFAYDLNRERGRSGYAWLKWNALWGSDLSSETVVLADQFSSHWGTKDYYGPRTAEMDSDRHFRHWQLKQGWQWVRSADDFWDWGVYGHFSQAEYAYAHLILDPTPDAQNVGQRAVAKDATSTDWGAYVLERRRLSEAWTGEWGLRWDRQGLTDGQQVSPRLNFQYQPSAGQSFELGLGRFSQPHALHLLAVEDGQDAFQPATRVDQFSLSYRRNLSVWTWRIAAYYHAIHDPQVRFENFLRPGEFQGQLESDRIRIEPESSRAFGFEWQLSGKARLWSWSANYTYARIEDQWAGKRYPRPWDQPHAANFSLTRRSAHGWDINLNGIWHSGWPTTSLDLDTSQEPYVVTIGPLYDGRLPNYHRM
ncbi:MAG: TonB-dependent receptor, partial [Acidobacteria bacterium]|nr:TonB-dependent receptor [Acidobacteriota bacterium]